MEMLGHDHVSMHHELIALLGFFQDLEKAVDGVPYPGQASDDSNCR
jgi:hypothetical protein